VVWQHVLGVACVLCAGQNETELGCVFCSSINSAFVGESSVLDFRMHGATIHSYVMFR
jgi:hypothetical protein